MLAAMLKYGILFKLPGEAGATSDCLTIPDPGKKATTPFDRIIAKAMIKAFLAELHARLGQSEMAQAAADEVKADVDQAEQLPDKSGFFVAFRKAMVGITRQMKGKKVLR